MAVLAAGCHRSKRYETKAEVTRIQAVRKDPAGKPLKLDVEVSYSECPGSQSEVIRGGPDFAACASKYAVGQSVRLTIDHTWDPEGHYSWTVSKLGDCARVPEPSDDGSYAVVRECYDRSVDGTRVGFQCRHIPDKKLIDACPWFKRR